VAAIAGLRAVIAAVLLLASLREPESRELEPLAEIEEAALESVIADNRGVSQPFAAAGQRVESFGNTLSLSLSALSALRCPSERSPQALRAGLWPLTDAKSMRRCRRKTGDLVAVGGFALRARRASQGQRLDEGGCVNSGAPRPLFRYVGCMDSPAAWAVTR
jgi:hypothetical protein